ncbi:MAG: GHMP kinase [Candidatus Abyssubacteria bacterium]
MKIRATAPTRIDLAGGTLDLYPIYLFEDGGLTLNCAIDMFCSVMVEPRNDAKICLSSLDLGIEESCDHIDSLSCDGQLEIVSRAVRFFKPSKGLNIITENGVIKGSGLGASSSLLIAVLGALNALTNSPYSYDELIDVAADLEAQCIRVPTGKQDYYAAVFGGVSAIWFGVRGGTRENLLDQSDTNELERRLILSFTGAPRFSGATNWTMMRNYIDGNPETREGLKQIKEIALAMRSCLIERDWDEFAHLLNAEWQRRRTLGEGVTTEIVEKKMRAALEAGAVANKLCGAGGGGCMITYVRPEQRACVETALTRAGAQVLPFKITTEGVKIETISREKVQ